MLSELTYWLALRKTTIMPVQGIRPFVMDWLKFFLKFVFTLSENISGSAKVCNVEGWFMICSASRCSVNSGVPYILNKF